MSSIQSCLLFFILRYLDKKAPYIIKFAGRLSKYTLTILCWHYFVMQMFYAFAAVFVPGIWDMPGAGKSLVQLLGIIVSVTVCILLHLVYKRIQKMIRGRIGKE